MESWRTCGNGLLNYLSNRTQFTTVGESMSQTSPVTCGVPQGSVLGPFLFNLYTDDLPNVINPLENTCIEMYADNTTLYCTADDVDTAIAATNKALALIAEWCIMNAMVLHPVKCEAILLHRSVFIGPMQALNKSGCCFCCCCCCCCCCCYYQQRCHQSCQVYKMHLQDHLLTGVIQVAKSSAAANGTHCIGTTNINLLLSHTRTYFRRAIQTNY